MAGRVAFRAMELSGGVCAPHPGPGWEVGREARVATVSSPGLTGTWVFLGGAHRRETLDQGSHVPNPPGAGEPPKGVTGVRQ